MRAYAEYLIIVVERSSAVGHMGAHRRVVDIDVLHGVMGTFYMVGPQVRHGHNHYICLEKREECGPRSTEPDTVALDSVIGIFQNLIVVA